MILVATLRRFVLPLLLIATLGCDDDGSNSPTIGTPATVNLAGTWTGQLGAQGTGTALRATWTATQTGNSITGTIALTKPNANLDFTGTLSGTLSANRLTLTYSVPRGNVPDLADCTMSGSGTADSTNTAIAGTLNITYTNCQGFSATPTASEPLTLAK